MALDIFGDPSVSVRVWNPFTQSEITTYPSYREAGAKIDAQHPSIIEAHRRSSVSWTRRPRVARCDLVAVPDPAASPHHPNVPPW